MELQDYLRIVRKRWPIIAAALVTVLVIATLLTAFTTRTYQSSVQFFVSTAGSEDSGALLQGSTFTQQRVKSYSQLISTPKVLGPVIDSTGVDETSASLARRVTASVPADTVLIDVRVTGYSPSEAAAVAQAIGEEFPKTVDELEQVEGNKASPVKVTVVKPATESQVPVSPRPVRNLALAAVLGLLAGLGLAVLRDMLDTTIKSEDDVKEVTDATILGGIPFDSTAQKSPLVLRSGSKSVRSEAFRGLRTNLQFVDATDHPKSLSVTSSVPGEGKTTTAANLAIALADAGLSVCLVEGDLRRPKLLEYLGMSGAVGLTDVLIQRADLDDVLQPFQRGLTVLGSGATPPNPSELLGSQAMRSLVQQLEERFDYVIIDSPPLLRVTDSAIIATIVDGAIVVVGAGVAHDAMLQRALASMETVNANVLGIVINRVPRGESNRYGYYRYDYSPDGTRTRKSTSRSPRSEADLELWQGDLASGATAVAPAELPDVNPSTPAAR